ncbi:MAG: DUF11 domain-containing protein [Phycisphaeraceae bacterium]|nr:DUF11 domain-containing protein [Phycisphaeraceae bacterium]
MRIAHALAVTAGGLLCLSAAVAQPLSYTGTTIQQDFNSLPATGSNLTWTNGSTLPGWYAFQRALGGPNATGSRDANPWQPLGVPPSGTQTFFNTSTGSSTSGSVYSFGLDLNTERTLGSIGSGTSGDLSYGLVLVNNSGQTITEFTLSYKGRQWRNGGNTTAQALEFDYKVSSDPFDATQMAASLENSGAGAGWTRVNALDFTGPVATATAGALVGTDPSNTINISSTVTGISWAPGSVLYLRWFDDNSPGNDHGLGIDDLEFSTPIVTPAANLSLGVTDSPDPLQVVGGQLTYNIQLNNVGLGAANSVTITAPFPAGVSFVSSTIPGTTFIGQNLSIPLGNVAGSSTGTPITLVMQPNVAFPTGSPLSVTFTANPTAGDADPSNNVRVVDTVVSNAADLAVDITSDGTCGLSVGSPVLYTITATNGGPATATGVVVTSRLPSNTTFVPGGTASQGTVNVSSEGEVTWTVGALTNGANATLTVNASVATAGGLSNTAAITSAVADFNSANNSKTVRANAPSTATPLSVVHSSIQGAPTAQISVPTQIGNLPFEFSGNAFAFGRPFVSPDGTRWALTADTTAGSTENTLILTGFGSERRIVVREGYSAIGADVPTSTNPVFDRIIAINDDGTIGFTTRTFAAQAANSKRIVVRAVPGATPNDPYTYTVVARQDTAAPSVPGANYGGTASMAGIAADGSLSFYSNLSGPTAATNEVLLTNDGSTLLAREGVGIPTGQAGGTTFTYESFQNNFSDRGFNIAPGGSWIAESALTGAPTSSNFALTVDGQVRIQEGNPIPGSIFTEGVQFFNFNFMESDGNWFAYGSNLPPVVPAFNNGQDWVVRNGTVIAATGQPITPSSTETWSDSFLSRTFFLATGRGNNYVVGGFTSNTEFTRRVVVANGNTVILREGDPVDVNADGINNDNVYVNLIEDNRAVVITNEGVPELLIVVNLRDGSFPCQVSPVAIGQALLRIPLPTAPTGCSPADVATEGSPQPFVDGPDGFITGTDFDVFVQAFFAEIRRPEPSGPYIADLTNGDGTGGPDGFITGSDFDFFVLKFFEGCP